MYKTNSFLHRTLNAKKCAARVTGLQKPPGWVPERYQRMRMWVLNSDVQIDDNGAAIAPEESPYIWLGDVCTGRPKIFQPENVTVQHMIANPSKKSTTKLPLDASCLKKLITTLEAYYAHNFAAAVFVLEGFALAVHYEALINQYGCVPATSGVNRVDKWSRNFPE